MNYMDDPSTSDSFVHKWLPWHFVTVFTYLLTAVAQDFMDKLIADCYTGVASDADAVCVLQ